MPVEAWLLTLPLATDAGGFALQPFLRVTVTPNAVGLDNLAMLRAWRSQHLATALVTDASRIVPVADRAVVPLAHGRLLDESSPATALSAFADAVHRVRRMDDLRRAAAHGEAWSNVNVFIDPSVPWQTVAAVFHTLSSEGFTQANPVGRRGNTLVVRPLNVPGSEPEAPTPPIPLSVTMNHTGWGISLGSDRLANDCRAVVSVPINPSPRSASMVSWNTDLTALSRCLTTFRASSPWHERLRLQRAIHVDVAGDLPWRAVYAVMTAVEDTAPGRRDLFTNPVLGVSP